MTSVLVPPSSFPCASPTVRRARPGSLAITLAPYSRGACPSISRRAKSIVSRTVNGSFACSIRSGCPPPELTTSTSFTWSWVRLLGVPAVPDFLVKGPCVLDGQTTDCVVVLQQQPHREALVVLPILLCSGLGGVHARRRAGGEPACMTNPVKLGHPLRRSAGDPRDLLRWAGGEVGVCAHPRPTQPLAGRRAEVGDPRQVVRRLLRQLPRSLGLVAGHETSLSSRRRPRWLCVAAPPVQCTGGAGSRQLKKSSWIPSWKPRAGSRVPFGLRRSSNTASSYTPSPGWSAAPVGVILAV